MLNKLFPETNYEKLQYDNEGLYSITNYKEADIISSIIKNNFISNNNIKIYDGTGGLGGNTISFSKHFKNGDDTTNTRCFLQFFSLIPKSNNNNDAASNTSSSLTIEGS